MSEGSEPAVAAALAALARRAAGEPGATADLDRAVADLVRVDAKAMLAYVQTSAAAQDLEAGETAQAQRRAQQALVAASVVGRRSEMAVARALLGRAALARGDRATADAELSAARADRDTPLALSARAVAAVDALVAALGPPSSPSGQKPPRHPARA